MPCDANGANARHTALADTMAALCLLLTHRCLWMVGLACMLVLCLLLTHRRLREARLAGMAVLRLLLTYRFFPAAQ